MHIKFLDRGKGKGSTATDYIMSDKDHEKNNRYIAPIVLRGNPEQTGILADSLVFDHKYRSAVIAFHPDDKPTNEQLEDVLNEFEKVAFAGLEPDQYDFTAVLHKEENSEHIHIIVPRVELSTGKSMNIAQPGWKNTYDPLRDLFNEKNKWVSPDISQNPDIARITQLGREGTHKSEKAKTRADIKQSIENYLLDEIQQGNIQNRNDIKLSLMSLGFEIPRIGKDYITILDVETNTRIRLKGAIYEQYWTVERTLEKASKQQARADRSIDTERVRALERELENRIQERIEYNQSRYSRPERPAKFDVNRDIKREPEPSKISEKDISESVDTTAPDSTPDLFSHLQQHLGSDAIPVIPYQEPINRNKRKQENISENERSSDIDRVRQSTLREDRRERSRIYKWLQSFEDQINQTRLNDDRIRAEVNERTRLFIQSIQDGYDAATSASNDLNEASIKLEQRTSGDKEIISRGIGKLRENRNEELERFKSEINLVEYAAFKGYELVKQESSHNSKAMKHPSGDKIIVATDMDGHGIYFSVSNGDSGSIIDFVQHRENKNLGQIRKELRAFSGFTDIQDYKSHSKPLRSSKDTAQAAYVLAQAIVTDAHPYLLNERKISAETLKDKRFKTSIKIDKRNNALFPHFNSNGIAGFEIKNKDFTGYAKGGEKGLWYSSNIIRADCVVIVESAIDALSHAELKQTGEETAYVSIAGSMSSVQFELIKKVTEGKQIIIATDNDDSGNKYAEQIKAFAPTAVREVAEHKDWNDDLKALKQDENKEDDRDFRM